jgi:hypothetical protein
VSAAAFLGGIFDYDAKKERLEEVNAELEQPDVYHGFVKSLFVVGFNRQLQQTLHIFQPLLNLVERFIQDLSERSSVLRGYL